MRIDSRKPKAAALSAALTVALLAGAGATDAHAATLSDTVGSTPSETTLVQPVDYRGDGYGSMQEWNASMEAKRDSLEMRAQIIMNMYGDYATDDERAVLQGCIDGAGSLLTMGEVDAKSTELDELRTALEDAKREALEAQPGEQTISVSQSKSAYEGLFIYTGTFEDLTPDKDTPVYAVLGGVCYEACPTEAGFQLLTPAGSGLSLLVCMDGVYQCLQATIE